MNRFIPLATLLLVACGTSSSGTTPPDDAGQAADTGTLDTGAADALADGSFVSGTPITATAGQWTWVPFPDSACGDGSPVGIGVNPSATGTRLLIYLEGGGGCWDESTCYTLQTASYFTTGYSQTTFQTESTDATYLALPGGFFDRSASANPFADYSYVYVPYCTGDIHAGSNVAQYGAHTGHHAGFTNFAAFLKRIAPTFAKADRVILAGSSAGGYGAVLNLGQTQQAFGGVRVDLLDDSGTFIPPDILAQSTNNPEPVYRASWNLAAALPSGCTACGTDLSALYAYYANALPSRRGSLLVYQQDSVIPVFYSITTAQFETGLSEDLAHGFAPATSFQSFQVGAAGHVLFFSPTLAVNGTTVQAFVTSMVTDDPSWTSVHP